MVIPATKLRVLDPTQQLSPVEGALAPRVAELAGKSVGLLANGKRNADRLLNILAQLIQERQPVREIVARSKGNASVPAPDSLLDELAQRCDAIIVGVGD